MSDYLGHLVERSFAPVPAVRPNTPSRFESSPGTSPVDHATEADLPIDSKTTASPQRYAEPTENNASRFSNPARETNRQGQRQFAEHSPTGAPEKKSAETLESFSPFVAPLFPSRISSPATRSVEPPGLSAAPLPRSIQPSNNAAIPAQGINPEPGFSPEIRPSTAATKGTFHLDGLRPKSSVPRKENEPSPSREISTPPSTIHVTIGRVEIKATPPPPTPARTIRQKNPALSLESYLQRRSNGGRDE